MPSASLPRAEAGAARAHPGRHRRVGAADRSAAEGHRQPHGRGAASPATDRGRVGGRAQARQARSEESRHGKFINPPPLIAPTWFQDRHLETQQIGEFLKDEALRLMTVVGRGGVGKSAMVCRLLRSLEGGQLPDDGGALAVDGIVYLSDARSFHRANVPDLYAGLTKLLSDETVKPLDAVYKNPQATHAHHHGGAGPGLSARTDRRAVGQFRGCARGRNRPHQGCRARRGPARPARAAAPRAQDPHHHACRAERRWRWWSRDASDASTSTPDWSTPMPRTSCGRWTPTARLGCRHAPAPLLAKARERTLGYPRALEHLFGILSADRDTSLQEILDDTRQLLPEQVVAVLVGEAFSRLDLTAQRVMQALAIYRYPVPPAAVDYLLQAHIPGMESGPSVAPVGEHAVCAAGCGTVLHPSGRPRLCPESTRGRRAS